MVLILQVTLLSRCTEQHCVYQQLPMYVCMYVLGGRGMVLILQVTLLMTRSFLYRRGGGREGAGGGY